MGTPYTGPEVIMAKKSKVQPPKPRPTVRTSTEKAAAKQTKKRMTKRGACGHG